MSKTSDTVVAAGQVQLPQVNLMPPEIQEKRRFQKVQGGLAGAVVAALLIVGLLYLAASGGVSNAQEELDAAGAQQRTVQAETARYRDVTATYKRAADAQAMLVAAMGEEVRYSRFLNDLTLTIPENVWIKNITYTQTPAGTPVAATSAAATAGTPTGIGTVAVTGIAFEHTDVAAWLDSLADQKGYLAPTLQSSTEALLGTKQVTNWSSTIVLTADALSDRYRAGS